MKEKLIKTAKEKGFKSNISFTHKHIYLTIEPDFKKIESLNYYLWLCELQKWLRDKHNINIDIEYIGNYSKIDIFKFQYSITKEKRYNGLPHKTYEEALQAGLIEALKLIK